jgi:hypothetical protein
MKLREENRSTLRKTCSSATLSTTNPTWTYPGSNPGLRGERLATNRLSHGKIIWAYLLALGRYSDILITDADDLWEFTSCTDQ